MQTQTSGWRFTRPANNASQSLHTSDKTALFESARLCCRVLRLPSSCRFLLDQLCASYGGKPVQDKILVWPSNEYLEERTGISERTIRHAVKRLIDLGVIKAKDSPNGKRFAKRDRSGAITEVYGFDLSPLLYRLSEFKDHAVALDDADRHRRSQFDQITIHRRSAQEALTALSRDFAQIDTSDLEERARRLSQSLPRRSGATDPSKALTLWAELRKEVDDLLITASGGKNDRHIDTNTKAADITCYRGGEDEAAERVQQCCPDALAVLGSVTSDEDLVRAAERYRGMLGVSLNGWREGQQQLGVVPAAVLLYLVTQVQAKPAPGAQQIRNLGGYYRSMVRMIASGQIDLEQELLRHQAKVH